MSYKITAVEQGFPEGNLANPDTLPQLKADVEASKGQVLLVTHPFFGLPIGSIPSIENLYDGAFKIYLANLAKVAQGFQQNGIPMIIQQDVEKYWPSVYPAYQRLGEAKAETLLDLAEDKVYWTLTRFRDPEPILSTEITASNLPPEQAEDWVKTLETAGIKKAFIAGRNLGGDEGGCESQYFKEADPILAEHFLKIHGPDHPFAKIKPYGCVAKTMRFLAQYSDQIEIVPTTATYPSNIPSQDKIVPNASRSKPWRIIS